MRYRDRHIDDDDDDDNDDDLNDDTFHFFTRTPVANNNFLCTWSCLSSSSSSSSSRSTARGSRRGTRGASRKAEDAADAADAARSMTDGRAMIDAHHLHQRRREDRLERPERVEDLVVRTQGRPRKCPRE